MKYEDIELFKQELKPYDFVIVKVDIDKFSLTECRDIYDALNRKFPDNEIILVPDGITLEVMDWKRLLDFVLSVEPEGEENGR